MDGTWTVLKLYSGLHPWKRQLSQQVCTTWRISRTSRKILNIRVLQWISGCNKADLIMRLLMSLCEQGSFWLNIFTSTPWRLVMLWLSVRINAKDDQADFAYHDWQGHGATLWSFRPRACNYHVYTISSTLTSVYLQSTAAAHKLCPRKKAMQSWDELQFAVSFF